jgi:hypothetical protein
MCTLELAELAVEGAQRQMAGLPRHLQDQAVREAQGRSLPEMLQRRLLEQRSMHVLRAVAARPPDHDPFAVLLPFQDRARADAQPPADFGGHGDLPLCGQLRVRDRHA